MLLNLPPLDVEQFDLTKDHTGKQDSSQQIIEYGIEKFQYVHRELAIACVV